MRIPSASSLPAALLCAGLLAGCGPKGKLAGKPPEVLPGQEPDTIPAISPTYVKAPLTIDLGPLLASLETDLPRHFGDLEQKIKVNSLAKVSFDVVRGPMAVTFDSNAVRIRLPFEYAAKAWGPLGVSVGSCGVKEARPRAAIDAVTRFELQPDWRLRTRTHLELAPHGDTDRDKCRLSVANFDVTQTAMSGAEGAANDALKKLDRKIGRLRLDAFIGKYWLEMQKPIRVMDSTLWLTLNPEGVGVGSLFLRDSVLHAELSVRASPRMLSGPRPEPGTVALPPFVSAVGEDILVGLVEGRMAFADANVLLNRELAGKSIPIGARRTKIKRLETSYAGRGHLAIGVEFSGQYEGQVWFVGRPVLDTVRRQMTIPDLELDVNSESALLEGASFVAGDKLRDYLRESIVISTKDLIEQARELANKELTRNLSADVRLIGHLDSARTLDIRATPDGLLARARAVGTIRLDITAPPPPIKKPRRTARKH
jgi:hypothetical protein